MHLPGHPVRQQLLSNHQVNLPNAKVAEREQGKKSDRWETWGNGEGDEGEGLGKRERVEKKKGKYDREKEEKERELKKKTKGKGEARREPRPLVSILPAPLDKETVPRAVLAAAPVRGRAEH